MSRYVGSNFSFYWAGLAGDSSFMEDFSDMLLLKLLNTSIIAADDNEKVCIYKSKHCVMRIRVCKIGSKGT